TKIIRVEGYFDMDENKTGLYYPNWKKRNTDGSIVNGVKENGFEDVIHGTDDDITGDEGNDILIGGSGNDLLDGGSGSDRYIFEAGHGQDTVTEWDVNPKDINSLEFTEYNSNEL
ncbi:Hemolysin-type calcium-binding repeat (2 copies), partial [Snodgrassella alvi SCGC AB-598-J21]